MVDSARLAAAEAAQKAKEAARIAQEKFEKAKEQAREAFNRKSEEIRERAAQLAESGRRLLVEAQDGLTAITPSSEMIDAGIKVVGGAATVATGVVVGIVTSETGVGLVAGGAMVGYGLSDVFEGTQDIYYAFKGQLANIGRNNPVRE